MNDTAPSDHSSASSTDHDDSLRTRRLHLLVVTSQFPYPPTWGAGMRVYQLTRHLAAEHDVTLLCYAEGDAGRSPEHQQAVCQRVELIPRRPLVGMSRRLLQARALASSAPFHGRTLFSAPLQQALDRTLQQGVDVVQVEGSPLMCLQYPPDTIVVLDEHNIESEVLQRMHHAESSVLRRSFNGLEARKYRALERRAWRRASACVVTSEREVPTISAFAPTTPVKVVPNGVDTEYFTDAAVPEAVLPGSILFTGLLSYRPNLDGVRFFIDEVLPAIRARQPTASLIVVGGGSANDLQSLRGPHVQVAGLVPDLRPYLSAAACVVAPLRMGGGTRLKVLEALSMSKALVSTTIGCEGIDVTDGEHLIVADDPSDMAAAVCQVLSDPSLRNRLGAQGRALVVDRYSWRQSARGLQRLHAALTGAGA